MSDCHLAGKFNVYATSTTLETDVGDKMMQNWIRTRASVKKLQELLHCGVCNKPVKKPCALGACEHFFCQSCIEDHKGEACPVCGIPAHAKYVQSNRQLDSAATLCAQIAKLLDLSESEQPKEEENVNETTECTLFTSNVTTEHAEGKAKLMSPPISGRTRKRTKAKKKREFIDKSNEDWNIGSEEVEPCSSCKKKRNAMSRRVAFGDEYSTPCEVCVLNLKDLVSGENTETSEPNFEESAVDGIEMEQESNSKENNAKSHNGSRAKKSRRKKSKENTSTKQQKIGAFLKKKTDSDKKTAEHEPGLEEQNEEQLTVKDTNEQPWPSPRSTKGTRSSAENNNLDCGTEVLSTPKFSALTKPKKSDRTSSAKKTPTSCSSSRRQQQVKSKTELSVGVQQQPWLSPMSTPTSKRPMSRMIGSPGTPSTCHSPLVNKKNPKGETPLQVACIKGDMDQVKALLEDGATVNTKDNAGWTPLHEACNHGHHKIAEHLLDAGALINVPGGPDNDAPLHDAVANHRLDCVRLLVARGASVVLRNSFGKTPTDLAVTRNVQEILRTSNSATAVDKTQAEVAPSLEHMQTVVVATGLDREQKNKMNRCAQMLHGKMVQEFGSSVTHVVTSINQEGMCPRTLKYLHAVLAGKWIVNFDWVETCLEYNSHVSEEAFEVPGTSTCPNSLAPSLGRQNRLKQLPGLFSGCHFYLHGTFQYPTPSRADLTGLVRAAGGAMLQREPRLESIDQSQFTVPYHVAADGNLANCSHFVIHDKKNVPAETRGSRLCWVPATWVMDSIAQFKILDIGRSS